MRDIRFRAWKDGRMIGWEDLLKTPMSAFNEMFMTNPPQSVAEFMQFTGLHDRNGVEIYEGDVLTCDYPQMPDRYPPKFLVKWEDEWNGWSFKPELIFAHGFYVAGNIHEHPELLSA